MADFWAYPTNYSNGSVTGVFDLMFDYPSYILGGWFGYGVVLLIWCAFFGLGLMMGSRKALLYASFISFVFATYLSAVNLLNPIVPVMLIVMVVIGIIASKGETTL